MRARFVALGLGFASGCAWHSSHVTAMQIPCSPGDIAVANDRVEAPYRKWDAHCRPTGVDYECSSLGTIGGAVIRCQPCGAAASR